MGTSLVTEIKIKRSSDFLTRQLLNTRVGIGLESMENYDSSADVEYQGDPITVALVVAAVPNNKFTCILTNKKVNLEVDVLVDGQLQTHEYPEVAELFMLTATVEEVRVYNPDPDTVAKVRVIHG